MDLTEFKSHSLIFETRDYKDPLRMKRQGEKTLYQHFD